MGKNEGVIRLQNISKIYLMGDTEIRALDEVSLTVCKGSYVAVMGPSGCGKTTMLDVMSTMLSPTSGDLFIEGTQTTKMSNAELANFRGKKIGFIFQTFNLLPRLTALENVIVPLWINDYPRDQREDRAKQLLEEFGLKDRMYNRPNQLSGGQRQRVAVARALAMDPPIIVADEPTGNLDTKSANNVTEIINSLHTAMDKTVIMVTHNPELAKNAERIIKMIDGKLITDEKNVCKPRNLAKIKTVKRKVA